MGTMAIREMEGKATSVRKCKFKVTEALSTAGPLPGRFLEDALVTVSVVRQD
jgi:hypothetical protein